MNAIRNRVAYLATHRTVLMVLLVEGFIKANHFRLLMDDHNNGFSRSVATGISISPTASADGKENTPLSSERNKRVPK